MASGRDLRLTKADTRRICHLHTPAYRTLRPQIRADSAAPRSGARCPVTTLIAPLPFASALSRRWAAVDSSISARVTASVVHWVARSVPPMWVKA